MKKWKTIIMPALLAGTLIAAGVPHDGGFGGAVSRKASAAETPREEAVRVIESAAAKLRDAEAYTTTAAGKAVAKKGFITYEQKIAMTMVGREDACYARSETTSPFVKMKHEAYVRGGRVAYRNGGGNVTATGEADYAAAYGIVPGRGLEAHTISADTIVAARFVSAQNGLFTYFYELDGDRSSAALKKQMQAFAKLKSPPECKENPRLTLTVREDNTPVSLETAEKYTVVFGLLGKVTCTQTLSYTFAPGDAAVPDEAQFTAALSR